MEANKTGVNKLAERILADARENAEAVACASEKELAAVRAESEANGQATRKDCAKKREAAVQAVLDGNRTRAAIDGKKQALAKKRIVIDEAFDKAYRAMLALAPEKRGALCAAMLKSEAEGGETVIPATADRTQITEIVRTMEAAKLTLSVKDASIDGGFILTGAGYEKDCSFRAMMDELRMREETNVAKMLFD